MQAIDTTYNGASREAWEAIESVKPPMAVWNAYQGTVTTPRDGQNQTLRVYKLVAHGITSGAISGPMGTMPVATAIFASDGGRLSHDAIARLERNDYHAGVPTGWHLNVHIVGPVRDLLRALAHQ